MLQAALIASVRSTNKRSVAWRRDIDIRIVPENDTAIALPALLLFGTQKYVFLASSENGQLLEMQTTAGRRSDAGSMTDEIDRALPIEVVGMKN